MTKKTSNVLHDKSLEQSADKSSNSKEEATGSPSQRNKTTKNHINIFLSTTAEAAEAGTFLWGSVFLGMGALDAINDTIFSAAEPALLLATGSGLLIALLTGKKKRLGNGE